MSKIKKSHLAKVFLLVGIVQISEKVQDIIMWWETDPSLR